MSLKVNRKVTQICSEYINNGNASQETAKLKLPGGHVMIKTKDALGRLKDELGLHTDNELAEAMSVGIRRIHNWKQRNTVPTEAIVAICGSEGLDLEYILTGNKAHAGRQRQAGQQSVPDQVCNDQPRVCPPHKRFTQRDSYGNEVSSFESSQIVDVLAPGINWLIHALGVQPEDLLLMKIIGDDMVPWVQDGDLVLIDTSYKSTINGGVLALRYSDGTMVVRRVIRNPDGTLYAKCDAIGCELESQDISNEDMYPIVVGRVVRRLVK